MGVPYTFGTATTSIPLSNLDANFNTPVTIGSTGVGLGNTTTTLAGLSNVSTTLLVATTANVTTQNVTTSNLTNLTVTNDASISGLTVGKGGGAVATNVVVGGNGSLGGGSQTGTNNTALGDRTLTVNTSGSYNTATGQGAVYLNTTGSNNSGFGSGALQSNTTGSANTALGVTALYSNTTASNNTAVGYQAGYTLTSGATNNAFFGYQAGYSTITSGSNQFFGYEAGKNVTTGYYNTIVGAYNGNQGGLDIRTANNYIVLADGQGNPRGVFDGSGTFFIGAFTSPSGTQRLVLTANGSAGIEPMLFNELRSSAATENYVRFYRNGSQVGSITNTLSATAYVTSSDYRLKENIAPMTGALAKVAQLKPVTYKWKATGEDGQGFIAHELQAIVPDCVSGEKDAVDTNGNPQYQGIDTSFLVATLTAAIQEQQTLIADLQARLAKAGL